MSFSLLPELARKVGHLHWVVPVYRCSEYGQRLGNSNEITIHPFLWERGSLQSWLSRLLRRCPRYFDKYKKRFDNWLRDRWITEFCSKNQINVLFFNCVFSQRFPKLALPIPVVGVLHDLNYRSFKGECLNEVIASWLAGADVMVFDAKVIESEARKAFSPFSCTTKVIPLAGPDTAEFRCVNPGVRDSRIIFYPASFAKHKNHTILLEAAKRLALEGESFQLIFTGGRTEELLSESELPLGWKEHCRGLVRELQKKSKVEVQVLGYVTPSRLREIYSSCGVIVFPSLYEGFGLPLLEGFGQGIPVICSDIAVFREQEELYKIHNWLQFFPEDDLESLVKLLRTNFRHPQIRADRDQIEQALKAWTWSDVAESYRLTFENLVQARL